MNHFEPDKRARAWVRALGASLLLHAVLVGLLLAMHDGQPLPGPVAEETALTRMLVVVSENPQRRRAATATAPTAEPDAAPEPEVAERSEAPTPAIAATESPLQQTADERVRPVEALVDSPVDSPLDSPVDSSIEPAFNTSPAAAAELPVNLSETAEVPVEAFSVGGVRAMVKAYVQEITPVQTEQWLTACLLYNKEHGTRECPGERQDDYSGSQAVREHVRAAFASVLRPQQQRRALQSITAKSAFLAPLLKGDGELAGLARDEYYLNGEYTDYLRGNFNFQIQNFVDESLRSHSYGGNGNAAYISNMLQPVCNPQPCIWEYTGFAILRPEPEPEVEGAPPVFHIKPSLFGTP